MVKLEESRGEHAELRDKLNNLRENDLFSLREKVSQVNIKFAGAAAVIGFLGLAGINTYWNLDKLIDNRVIVITAISGGTRKRTGIMLVPMPVVTNR